jgi:hypothetical protein
MARNEGEEGSTALEALIAIALLSVALGTLVAGSRGGIAALGRVRTAAEEAAAVLRADDALRSAAARVRIPYWARAAEPEAEDGRLSVPWCDGKADGWLVLSSGEDGLNIAGGGDALRFPASADARFAVIRGGGERLRALRSPAEPGPRGPHRRGLRGGGDRFRGRCRRGHPGRRP